MSTLKKQKKFDLRQACIDKVTKELGEDKGKEFAEKYDKLNQGGAVADLNETIAILQIIQVVKEENGIL